MQQLFRLLIFLIQPYMFRATNSHCRCIVPKSCVYSQKCSWWCANLSPETWAELKD